MPEINVGIQVASSPAADADQLSAFAGMLGSDVAGELENATGHRWVFHLTDRLSLRDDETRRPSDFLDEASIQMIEGPFDLVIVVTDVGISARGQALVAGVASPAARIAVISTRKLVMSPRGESLRQLAGDAVRYNGAALLLHLIGHMLGVDRSDDVMRPFAFDAERRMLPTFGGNVRTRLPRMTEELQEEVFEGGALQQFLFHIMTALRYPKTIGTILMRNRAPLLPLSLPSLATAAVAPTFILVFTAEIWDVGLNMTNNVALVFSIMTVLGATWYLTVVQDLFFPRKENRRITRHMALVNVVVFLTILLAIIGLFAMLGLLMLFIETYIFPPGLIATWPTLENPTVGLGDKVRLAAFMSAVGVLTGALAGGLESRTVIRHLALFLRKP